RGRRIFPDLLLSRLRSIWQWPPRPVAARDNRRRAPGISVHVLPGTPFGATPRWKVIRSKSWVENKGLGHKFNSGRLESQHVADLLEIAHPELNDPVGNEKDHTKVHSSRSPLGQSVQLARALRLIIQVQTVKGLVKFAADFSGRVLVREHVRKPSRTTNHF